MSLKEKMLAAASEASATITTKLEQVRLASRSFYEVDVKSF